MQYSRRVEDWAELRWSPRPRRQTTRAEVATRGKALHRSRRKVLKCRRLQVRDDVCSIRARQHRDYGSRSFQRMSLSRNAVSSENPNTEMHAWLRHHAACRKYMMG